MIGTPKKISHVKFVARVIPTSMADLMVIGANTFKFMIRFGKSSYHDYFFA
jgi:hypothetical protein